MNESVKKAMIRVKSNKNNKDHKQRKTDIEYNILVEQSCAYSVILKSYHSWEMERLKTYLKFPKQGLVAMVSIHFENESDMNRMKTETFYKEIYQIIKETQGTDDKTCIGPLIQNRIGIIFAIDEGKPDKKGIYQRLELFMDEFKKKYRMYVTIGVGSSYDIKEIHHSYIEAMRCLRQDTLGRIIHIEELKNCKEFDYHKYVECENNVLSYVKRGEVVAIDYFVEILYMLQQVSVSDRKSKIFEVLLLSKRCVKNLNIFQNDTLWYYEQLSKLQEEEIDIWAITQFSNIVKFLETENQNQMYGMIQVARKYIEENYTKDINLEEIARYVSVSPQYFSKLFKEKTGSTYIDYITNIRVMKAQELVKHTNKPIQEICFSVGYKDPNYFSRIFKKNIGMTPSQYRKTFLG